MRLVFVFSFSLFFLYQSNAAIKIYGSDTSYAGQELVFNEQADPFTRANKILGSVIVDDKGVFEISIAIEETTYIYCYSGVHLLYLFVEPGKEYNLVLPLFTPKTRADKLNPFFNTIDVHLGIRNFTSDELNVQIRMFLDTYIPYYNKHLDRVFTDNDFEQLNKDIEKIEKPFKASQNYFFNYYREYKYGMLRMLAYQHKSKAISDQYFKQRPVLYKNPAYIELFNMVYENYFTYFSKADSKNILSGAIRDKKSYEAVKIALSSDSVLQSGELLGMVTLKCLHDEFYDDNYSRKSMLTILDDFIEKEQNEVQKQMAGNIRNKVIRLLVGFAPPQFNLLDMDSNLVSLEKFKGKHVYLNFCSCFSYSCLNEFAMLQGLYQKHKRYLEIVTIVADDNMLEVKDFIERSGYSWTFLHYGNQPDIFLEYDVRIYPTYYLVDHTGKLSMSPASTPNEAFEGRLFKELRAKGIL